MDSKDELTKSMYGAMEFLCREIARMRRNAELSELDMEEFDNKLNELSAKWYKHYEDMDKLQMLVEMLSEPDVAERIMERLGD